MLIPLPSAPLCWASLRARGPCSVVGKFAFLSAVAGREMKANYGGDCHRYQRYIMEDRWTAIRYAIGTAGAEDIVVIAGKGAEDYQEIFEPETGELERVGCLVLPACLANDLLTSYASSNFSLHVCMSVCLSSRHALYFIRDSTRSFSANIAPLVRIPPKHWLPEYSNNNNTCTINMCTANCVLALL